MNLGEFLTPLALPDKPRGFVRKHVIPFDEAMDPDTPAPHLAIVGVEEDRRSLENGGTSQGIHPVRKHLYLLEDIDEDVKIADLGTILKGNTYEDTQQALKTVCTELMSRGVIPIIIGGGQDLTYSCYSAFESLEQTINLVTVDRKLDFGERDEELNAHNYLNNIILHQPNYLFNFCNIGHQRYLVDGDMLELMGKMYFDTLRLGEANQNITRAEACVRDADILSFDISAIRHSDAPGCVYSGPNGLYGEQACQIMKYAGMSDKLNLLGIFDYNPEFDRREITAQLIAQMIWCFADGYTQRKGDYPIGDKKEYLRYTVSLESKGHELVFYKSHKSDRWWLDVPYPAGMRNKYERHHLVPCNYEDYQLATNDEIPDKWWRAYQKLT